jgi:hypothetical protein
MKLNEAIIQEFDEVINDCVSKIDSLKTIDFSKSHEEIETATKIVDNTFEYHPHDRQSNSEGKDEPLEILPKPRTGSKIELENDNNILLIEELRSMNKSYFPFEEHSAKDFAERRKVDKKQKHAKMLNKVSLKDHYKDESEGLSEDDESNHVVEKFESKYISKDQEINEQSEIIQK